MLRTPRTEQEFDLLHGAMSALSGTQADFVNFVLPLRTLAAWKPEEPPNDEKVPYYTVRNQPIGRVTVEWGDRKSDYPVHRITQNGKKIMDIVPQLRSIYEEDEHERTER